MLDLVLCGTVYNGIRDVNYVHVEKGTQVPYTVHQVPYTVHHGQTMGNARRTVVNMDTGFMYLNHRICEWVRLARKEHCSYFL